MISVAMYIGSIIATAVITSLVVIFLTPLKKWVYRDDIERCSYGLPRDQVTKEREVIVTKYFNTTRNINCYWFDKRKDTTEDGVFFKHCTYGEAFLTPNRKGASQCPYDKQYS